jgi:8-hydroxy-5-deazaflavin:NADPH oxidoreductase
MIAYEPMASPDAIAILGGTGQQGRGLAQRLAMAGERIIVGSRDPDRARATIAGWRSSLPAIDVADNVTAVTRASVTILAVPFPSVDALLADLHPHFRPDSLVIDLTVPVTFAAGKMAMIAVPEGSAAQHIRTRLPASVRLAGTFKTLPAHLLDEVERSLDCDEFVCGDSDQARAQASALVGKLRGVRAIDVGSLSRAESVEHLTALAIAINRRHKIREARFRVVGLP